MKSLIMRLKVLYSNILDARQLRRIQKQYRLCVMSPEETIAYIKEKGCSVTRYGDGEFQLMLKNGNPNFQQPSDQLAKRLLEVLENTSPELLICVPRFMVYKKGMRKGGKRFWSRWALSNQAKVFQVFYDRTGRDYVFGDSYISRPYTAYQSKKRAKRLFPLLKELWDGRDLLFVEGEGTRLGIGNDLFSNAKSIKRILAPAENAFDTYPQILNAVREHWKGELVILAVGPTATILASDLSLEGIQTIDIGHIDIQYEWYLAGDAFKPVANKYVNEVIQGRSFGECTDQEYLSQIIARVQ